jgi:putative ABC transport system permease protein
MNSLFRDIRYALRMVAKNPAITSIMILSLALGIGANSAIFSVVDAVLLRPMPFREPGRLFMVFESSSPNDAVGHFGVAPGNFLDWRKMNTVFEQIGAFDLPEYNLTGTDRPERVPGAAVSGGTLNLLGLQPELGREIQNVDDRPNADPVAMISHSLWQRRFAGDPLVIGRTIHLGPIPYTIIGVLPAGFTFPQEDIDVWVPLEQSINEKDMQWRDSHYLAVYGRLKSGVTLDQARSDMNRVAASLKQTYPNTNSGPGVYISSIQEDLVSDIRPALLTLLVSVGLVLLIACANVANLLLVRATGRAKEMSVRLALGARSSRLVRQMLTESVILSLAGGAAGLIVATWARQALLALRPVSLPSFNAIETDTRVLLFTLGLSLITGILFGLAPALRATSSDLSLALHGASRGATPHAGAHRLHNLLVAGEIAISLMLLIGATLLIKSFVQLRNENQGFRMDHTVTSRVSIPREKYVSDDQVFAFYDRLLENVRALPGVESVGMVSFLPLTGQNFDNTFDIVGRPVRPPSDPVYALVRFIDPQFFSVLQIPILRGRGIEARDRMGSARAVVISESMARKFWPGGNALGQHLLVYMGKDHSPWEVVGIVQDVRANIAAQPQPTMYFPCAQYPYRYMVLTVRTHSAPQSLVDSIRGVVTAIDPDQPLSQVRTLEEVLQRVLVPWRFSMTLLGAFAALALVLASAGIYGVISYAVGQRSAEIGIRIALGAQPRDVMRLILRQGMSVALAGIGVGIAASLYLTRFLVTQLYGVRSTDLLTFTIVPVALTLVALAASYFPARRATRVDPIVALRCE